MQTAFMVSFKFILVFPLALPCGMEMTGVDEEISSEQLNYMSESAYVVGDVIRCYAFGTSWESRGSCLPCHSVVLLGPFFLGLYAVLGLKN